MFPPIRTGTSFYSKNLATTLHNQGHEITVITVNNSDELLDEYPFDVVRIKALHIRAKNYFKHLRFTSFNWSNYKKVKTTAQSGDFQTILLVNHYLDIAFPAIYAAKKLKIPLYISVGTQMQSLNFFKNKTLRLLDRIICGRLIFPHCKNIISWDSEIERYISEVQRKKNANKSVIIPFGANGNISELSKFQKDYTLNNLIVGVGAIIDQRDYQFQILVYNELLKYNPNLKFKIIGHIYMEAPIVLAKKLGIYDKIEFLGEIPHYQVIEEIKKSDIHWMMLNGEYVGLGTATIEAMLMGIPSISNSPKKLFGKNELIDLENYIYSDGKNIDIIVNKIISVLSDKILREKIGQNGKFFVDKNLNWDYVGIEMINLFEGN